MSAHHEDEGLAEDFFLKRFILVLLCMSVFAYMYVSVLCVHWYPESSEMGIIFPGNGVMNDCEPPYGRWELNPSLLEEQPVLLSHLSSS